jgi:hypothetical protein
MQHGGSLAGEKPKLYYKNLHRRRFSWWSCAQAWLQTVFEDHDITQPQLKHFLTNRNTNYYNQETVFSPNSSITSRSSHMHEGPQLLAS